MSLLRRALATSGLAATIALSGAAVGPSAADAATGDPRLQLRLSQTDAWAGSLPPELFVGSGRLVPGGSVSDDIWVRNASSDPARLVVRSDSAGLPMSTQLQGMDLRTTVTAYPGPVTTGPISGQSGAVAGPVATFEQIEAGDRALSTIDLAPGQQVRLAVRVAMPAAVGDTDGTHAEDGQWGSWLRLDVSLMQHTVVPPAGGATSPPVPAGGQVPPAASGVSTSGAPTSGSSSAPQARAGAQARPPVHAAPAARAGAVGAVPADGPLAYTGAETLPALVTGAGLVSAGWFLVAAARRRRDDEDERTASEV